METIISIRNLFFGYRDKMILEDINLDIYEGDYIGIVGPNGSGKSTLIKLMLNILKPVEGEIKLFGQDINRFNEWDKIGYVAQKSNSFNKRFPATVEEVVAMNLYPKVGLFRAIKRSHLELVHNALKIVNMEKYKDRLIGDLSGGQQQRVFIARALVNFPKVIFLDEPTVGIDIKSQEEFYKLLDKLNKEMKITIVMVTHDIGVISDRIKKIVCMGNGKLIIHDENSKMPFEKTIQKIYGDSAKILFHEH
ncbi:zinc ABC transporter ATP-binding protein [Caloranaerobacter azorensis H53214]|uniref:Zinc ABC transporter ATP-binding protein n=1 Tax=Caloranaerobacter azorensis H53214 TaxID=1156417 RepID=A0A096BIL8_9FIRM|nr:metal ABC transporter ATP-binding protein [Caloranaerobacter azorensis]KGG80712.1 zinc ABC transporter ATP-binding protein [Caloranaerobacter azorensis H53214]